jgi:6-phosphogluconolactonase/glucosamine-6-phosphate isomerase/deaminase
MNNFELISFADADELASHAAGAWLDEIESANRAGKPHCVALPGGRIAQKFFAATVEQAKARKIGDGGTPSLPTNVHFFWADERCVPPTDSESNFKLANDFLLAPLKISPSQIHRIRGRRPACRERVAPLCAGQRRPADAGFDFSRHGRGWPRRVAFPRRAAGSFRLRRPVRGY